MLIHNLDIIIKSNEQELLKTGLFAEDLQPINFIHFIEHGKTLSNQFSLKNLSLDQELFLLKFIAEHFSGHEEGLKMQLLNRLKYEVISSLSNKERLFVLLSDEIIKNQLVTVFLKDCEYLMKLLAYDDEGFVQEEIRMIVDLVIDIFQASVALSFDTTNTFEALKTELKKAMKRKKFRDLFRNEYFALANENRNQFLEVLMG
ncbi:hypothetical protein H7F33_09515 [Pedobacter sp. PAMC26386]|nr:hypothetical protein H7F33_09515 [Pedobacter sp. PAMC26386]